VNKPQRFANAHRWQNSLLYGRMLMLAADWRPENLDHVDSRIRAVPVDRHSAHSGAVNIQRAQGYRARHTHLAAYISIAGIENIN